MRTYWYYTCEQAVHYGVRFAIQIAENLIWHGVLKYLIVPVVMQRL